MFGKIDVKNIFDLVSDAVVINDSDHTITAANRAARELLGLSHADIGSRKCYEAFHGTDRPIDSCPMKRAEEEDGVVRVYIYEPFLQKHVEIAAFAQDDERGGARSFVHVIRDITRVKYSERRAMESERKFTEIADLLPETVFETDERGMFTYVNRYALESTGYTREDIRKGLNCIETFVPEDRERAQENFRRRMRGDDLDGIEYRMLKKDGGVLRVIVRADRILKDGRPSGIRGVVIDITKLKNIEDELKNTIRTKDMLIKEIYHRTKNNLAVIQSLLRLQLSDVSDDSAKACFQDTQNRVRSMSMIHERLSRSEALSSLNFSEFIGSLANHLYRSYNLNRAKVKLNLDIPDIYVDVEIMMPCGLIINELISNAFKYAFPEGREGVVSVELREDRNDEMTLIVRDNGIGIAEGVDTENPKSLGLQIVNSFVEQIRGTLDLVHGDGTEFRVRLNKRKVW